jgi:NTE family protein
VALLRPDLVPPWVGATAWLPHGRGQHATVRALVTALHGRHHKHHGKDVAPQSWADGRTWIAATDYDTGQRVLFGREGAPQAPLPDAVVASCSIPGWFPPSVIGDRRFVDGGTFSNTNLDLFEAERQPGGEPLDEVYVLAPMAARGYDRPSGVMGRLERGYRHRVTRRMLAEAIRVRQGGSRVIVLCPGPDDLEALGANLMDPARRAEVLATARRTTTEFLDLSRAVA